ncbi:hypothetical protein Esti_000070 [Eimeria stiedai]
MRIGMLVAAALPLLALRTLEVSRTSRRIRPAHEENIRKLIENDAVAWSQKFELPDSGIGNARQESIVPKEDYDDFKKSVSASIGQWIRALTKLMKPESVETLKRLTTSIASVKAHESGIQGYGIAPDKLTTLVESTVSAQRPGEYTPLTIAPANSWVQQIPQVPMAKSSQPLPPTAENEQPGPPAGGPAFLAPFLASPMYLSNMPLSQVHVSRCSLIRVATDLSKAQDASSKQLAPPGYEAFPDFQYVPQAAFKSDP